jgi:hypothetical protein
MSTREQDAPAVDGTRTGSWLEVLAVFFRLGLTSFGGPVAHLGYFREEFVTRRRWLDDLSYAERTHSYVVQARMLSDASLDSPCGQPNHFN